MLRLELAGRRPLIVLVLALAIVVPLASTSYSVAVNTFAEQLRCGGRPWNGWLGSGYRFVSATAEDDVRLVVAGTGELPTIDTLKPSVQGQLFGKTVSLEVAVRDRLDVRDAVVPLVVGSTPCATIAP